LTIPHARKKAGRAAPLVPIVPLPLFAEGALAEPPEVILNRLLKTTLRTIGTNDLPHIGHTLLNIHKNISKFTEVQS
jgi:hypothetical protein